MKCVLTAFSSILGIDEKAIIDELGHNGSEIVFPDLPEPLCRRGFDPRELVYYCFKRGINVTELDAKLMRQGANGNIFTIDKSEELTSLLPKNKGVLTGSFMGRFHAVAWNGEKIMNSMCTIENMIIHSFFVILP